MLRAAQARHSITQPQLRTAYLSLGYSHVCLGLEVKMEFGEVKIRV